MKNKTIGWIGTGIMGNPMAMHLINSGYKLNIYNRTKSKAQNLIQLGATWCNSPSEVVKCSDIVFTIIGYPKDVEQVYFGEDGILKTLRHGTILVDMTTTKPSLSIKIAQHAKTLGATAIDAPVSGGEIGAINGTLSIMIGGEEKSVSELHPIFGVIGKNIVYQGAAGSGQHAKMCNQIAIAGTMIGVCESLIYGYKSGLNLETLLASIGKGAAQCWTLDVLAPKVINGDFEPGFMVEHFIKDLGIALEEAEKMQLALPGLALAKQLYLSLIAEQKGTKGTQALYLALAKLSNIIPIE